jgi:hypothetical protein
MNLVKPRNDGLGEYMHKAVRNLGNVDSSNPCRWRGKWLHCHGGDACSVFVVLCDGLSLLVCKNVPEHNLKVHIFPYYKINRCYVLTHIGCTIPAATTASEVIF